jgi:hypothetical protein
MTKQQIDNVKWLLDYIESNANSFGYAVPGYWGNAHEAIDTYAIDADYSRRDVGGAGLAILDDYCRTGDRASANEALLNA